jgi:ribosomal protein S18 acetylase RimI-like enzyme
MILIAEENPNSEDALLIMDELSEALESITGSSGRSSFDPEDVRIPRALFVIARNQSGEAVGCGAIRPISENAAEVKRMYAKIKGVGIGSGILAYLEAQARKLGYSVLRLEARLVNQRAVSFYESRGYRRIPNYGKYAANPEAICFEKCLAGHPASET